MKNFTLTLLTFLLLHWKVSCTATLNDEHAPPLSAAALVSNNSTDSISTSSSWISNEKKSQRDQRTLYRRAGGHLRGDVSTSSTSTTTESPIITILNQSAAAESSTIASREVIYPVNSSKLKNHKSYFRRKTKAPSRNATLKTHRDVNENGSSSSNKVINVTVLDSSNSKDTNDSSDDENSLDYGLMAMSAAGEGNNNNDDDDRKKDDSKKTLSDQIAEGKYGLIEKEIFTKTPKAPGIISYKTNSETPDDNEKTLGGLSKDEIWLAEDHLLVLKGGITNDKKKNQNDEDWSPIDDYEAPKRPVKIPINPKVPPPFPIQLTENGPVQFIGHNQFSLFNPYTNETSLFANANGHISADINKANNYYEKDFAAGLGATKNFTKDEVHEVIPPWLFQNNYKDADLLKHFPFNLPLPDQVINRTEEFDEDDPSLFYPPPYSFVYKINYTNLAPVGPLVPGIILPPPPDFFSVYNPEEDKKPIKTPLDAYKRIKEIQLKNRLSASTTPQPSVTTQIPTRSTTFSSAYIRDFTRKTKPPTSTVSTTTKLHKSKSSTLRPTTQPTTILHSSTPPKELLNYKTHHFDTTTLRLHPVYVPTSVTTKIYSTVSTTTPLPPPPSIQSSQLPPHVKQFQKDYGTQAHPIYFEYFDARTANPLPPINHPFVGPEYDTSYISGQSTTSTQAPPQIVYSQPAKMHKKPKSYYPPQFISTTISPANVDAKFLFVTPKPDVYGSIIAPQAFPVSTDSPISYNTAIPIQKPLVLKPVGKFDDEIAAIKHTLNYYGGSKHTHKPSKVKAVYEFSFEASKHKQQHQQQQHQEEFKPMLSYDQKNAHLTELIKTNSYFPSSTEPTMKYYRTKQSATLPPKKIVDSPPPQMAYGQKLRQQNLNYYVRPLAYKEIVTSPHQSQQPQKIIIYPSHDTQSSQSSVSVDQNGYRVNSKNIKYNRNQNQQQQQYYGPASEVASLINDTLVNYKQPQRPINPFSEFIDVSRFPPQQNSPPHLRPQNSPPYHIYPQPPPQPHYHQHQQPIYPGPFQQQHRPQQFHNQQQQQQQHYQHPSLDVVKFEYPLIPQINPDSVHITFYNRPMEKSDAAGKK